MPLDSQVINDDRKIQESIEPIVQTINHDTTSLDIDSKQDPLTFKTSEITETTQWDLPARK